MPCSARYLAIVLPRLALDRLRRRERAGFARAPDEARARAIVATRATAQHVTAVDERGASAGLRAGMSLADARAMRPDLHVDGADPLADGRLLEGLADWARRWTPLVGIAAPDALVLDVAGCAHLFGGEAALLADVDARLTAQGFTVRAAIGPNPVAAEALARGRPGVIVEEDALFDHLDALPLASFRFDAQTIDDLGRLGLSTGGDLRSRPRAPLTRRFGARLMERFDQAMGLRATPITPRLPLPAYLAERRFAEPIGHRDDVVGIARALAAELARLLERHAEGARRLELALFRVDGGLLRIDLGTSRPVRDADLVADLVRRRLEALGETIDVGFGLDVVRLSVLEAGPSGARQASLDAEAEGAEAVARMIDRIGARLGETAIGRFVPVSSHLPERAVARLPAASAGGPPGGAWPMATPDAPPERPLRLFPTPEPVEVMASVPDGPPLRFRWRRALHDVARAEGPERIVGEWWRAPRALTRDYFRVEDRSGARFWLYRDGLMGNEAAMPNWFLHGVFA